MSYSDLSNTLDLPTTGLIEGQMGFNSMNSSFFQNSGQKFTDYDLLSHPANIDNLDSALTKIERLSMQLEDCQGALYSLQKSKTRKAMIQKTPSFKIIDPKKPAFALVECRLSELYQFRDELEKVLKKIEAEFFCRATISIGKLNLDLKVSKKDSPMINKVKIAQGLGDIDRELKGQESHMVNLEVFSKYFKDFESTMIEVQENNLVFIKHPEVKHEKRLKFVGDVENRLFGVYKAEEDTKLRELEWQIMTVNIKKSLYNDELKKLAVREQELSKFSRTIRTDTLKNAKTRQQLEEELENLEQQRYTNEILFNKKVESINEALQMLDGCRFEITESPHDIMIEVSKSPNVMTNEIQALEKQLKDLEYEFRNSKHPESLEALQTNITRIKSSILNYKSIQALQKTERTSSALRHNMNIFDKQQDTSIEGPVHRGSFISTGSDSSFKGVRKIPQRPLPAAIRMSPLKKLDVPAQKFNFNEVRTPTRGKVKTFISESPRSGTSGSLKVLEVILKEKEEELEAEEKKLQEMWMDNLEDGKLVQTLKGEITEYRRKRDENYRIRETLEKEKSEVNERMAIIKSKESEVNEIREEILEQKQRFEDFKKPICDKLEWLKEMLIKDIPVV